MIKSVRFYSNYIKSIIKFINLISNMERIRNSFTDYINVMKRLLIIC